MKRPLLKTWVKGMLALAALCGFFFLWAGKASLQSNGVGIAEETIALPEEKIDSGLVALRLAKEFHPDLNIPAYSRKIDELAAKVRATVNGSEKPEVRIGSLGHVLFSEEKFRYDKKVAAGGEKKTACLHELLDTKEGTCATLPLLYLGVAQRLGYPIFPVTAPGHFFLRYVSPSVVYNIEATNMGTAYTDQFYAEDFSLSEKTIHMGSYLRTLSYREFTAQLLANAAETYKDKGGFDKAISYNEKALEIDPHCVECHSNLEYANFYKSMVTEGKKALKYHQDAWYHKGKARELGYVDPKTTKAWRRMYGEAF